MFNIPVITWTLTTILLLGGSYHVLQAAKSRHLTDRVNKGLHALMNALMAAMLWNLIPTTMLAQVTVLTCAALWFTIQAVARPEFKILCTDSQGRLKCLYHALTMAGAALMLAMMAQTTTPGHGTVPAGTMSMPTTHHAMATAAHTTATPTLDHSPALAIPVTIFFGTAAAIFIILLLRSRLRTTTTHAHTPKLTTRTEHALEALGAAIMALMFATTTA
ncbi:DUF5134 domain-containing protein [Pseudarthrobacter sp. AB1]|uniref:DUF5134 domain-containing protein n=1 Tax=Pseudarthrobacter sp. AB1 TaxID=2138309 RepID=UPI00186BAE88|nr:DUF5134 domain-containing protein [Pseudarthrobacter sp. AB1]